MFCVRFVELCEIEVKVKCVRRETLHETDVKSRWYRSEHEVSSKWARSNIDMKSKWNRWETTMRSKWNRSGMQVNYNRNRSEIEVNLKWVWCEIHAAPKWNRRELEVRSMWNWGCAELRLKRDRRGIKSKTKGNRRYVEVNSKKIVKAVFSGSGTEVRSTWHRCVTAMKTL